AGSGASWGAAAIWRRGRKNQSSAIQNRPTGSASQLRKTAMGISICIAVEPDVRRLFFAADLQHGEKRFLGDLDLTHLFHALLAFLLLFQQLAFAGDVTAVTLGKHVLAQGFH